MSEIYDPAALIAATGGSLRGCARRVGIDPAMFYRPWNERQADRYATALDMHPGEVWPQWWDEHGGEDQAVLVEAAARILIEGRSREIRRAALLTLYRILRGRSQVNSRSHGCNRDARDLHRGPAA